LALKPSELRADQDLEEGTVRQDSGLEGSETGLLLGLHGTLPVEMAIAQPRILRPGAPSHPLTPDAPQAQLFADVVARTPNIAPKEIESTAERPLGRLPRWLIYLSLLFSVLIPLTLGQPLIQRSIDMPPAGIVDLHDEIDSLEDSALVLVAFDYDPTSSDEMNLVADTLVGHLMDRGTTLVAVSLLPAGPATAQALLDDQATNRPLYAGKEGERYANLGYLPAQAAGVRLLNLSVETALSRDFAGNPSRELAALERVTSVQDFDLILELAATQDTLRWWIEQASQPSRVPLAAGVSASVEPLIRPYHLTAPKQVIGFIGGIPGAAAYETLRSSQTEPIDRSAARQDAQLAGHLVFVLVLVVGNVAYLLRRGGGR
jgi:hypothetical protein